MTEGTDVLALSAEDFAQLEDYEVQQVLQLLAGHMAVAQSVQRENSESYHKYLEAKAEFSQFRQMASLLQTVARLAKP